MARAPRRRYSPDMRPNLEPGLCACGCGLPALKRYAKGHKSTNGPVAFWGFIPSHLPGDQCWEWQGYRTDDGYGRFYSARLAHRAVYATLCGSVPTGQEVCHTCDNPPCCNPSHLFLGAHADNMRDMARKGRASHSRLRNNKITAVVAAEIRAAAEHAPQKDIAERFSLSPSQVSKIVNGQAWAA
jgi:hypothetical protein